MLPVIKTLTHTKPKTETKNMKLKSAGIKPKTKTSNKGETTKTVAKAQKPAPTSPASKADKPAGVITDDTFDSKTFFVMSKAPTIQIKASAKGRKIPEKMQSGFLSLTGPHGTLIHPVQHDGTIYARTVGARQRYGCLAAIEKNTSELKAKFMSLKEILAAGKKINHAATIVRQSDDAEFTGFYVTEPGKSYAVFVAIDKSGQPTVMNTEPVRHYNAKSVQFTEKAKLDFAKVSAKLR